MILHISHIQWDTEGESQADCCLPDEIIVLNAPTYWHGSTYEDALMDKVEDEFGFAHDGYRLVELEVADRKPFKCGNVAIIQSPKGFT